MKNLFPSTSPASDPCLFLILSCFVLYNIFFLGACLVFTALICWTPYLLYHSSYIRVPEGHWFGVFTMWLVYCNALIDPLVYAFLNRRVRAEIKIILRRIRRKCSCCSLKARGHTITKWMSKRAPQGVDGASLHPCWNISAPSSSFVKCAPHRCHYAPWDAL